MYKSKIRVRNNSNGFTFIESLFQLVVLLLFSQFVVFIILWLQDMERSIDPHNATWEMFIFELQQYLENSKDIRISNNLSTLNYTDSKTQEYVQINQYGQIIRKQIDHKGHVPLYFDISKLKFILDGQKLTVTVELLNGEKKERTIFVSNNE